MSEKRTKFASAQQGVDVGRHEPQFIRIESARAHCEQPVLAFHQEKTLRIADRDPSTKPVVYVMDLIHLNQPVRCPDAYVNSARVLKLKVRAILDPLDIGLRHA